MSFLVNKSPLLRFFVYSDFPSDRQEKTRLQRPQDQYVQNDLLKNKVNFVTKDYLIQMTTGSLNMYHRN